MVKTDETVCDSDSVGAVVGFLKGQRVIKSYCDDQTNRVHHLVSLSLTPAAKIHVATSHSLS